MGEIYGTGVISVALEGEERDRVVVTGEKVDAAALTQSLRKKVGFASLVSVEDVESEGGSHSPSMESVEEVESEGGSHLPSMESVEEVENKTDGESVSSPPKQPPLMANESQQQWNQICGMVYDPNPPSCTIL